MAACDEASPDPGLILLILPPRGPANIPAAFADAVDSRANRRVSVLMHDKLDIPKTTVFMESQEQYDYDSSDCSEDNTSRKDAAQADIAARHWRAVSSAAAVNWPAFFSLHSVPLSWGWHFPFGIADEDFDESATVPPPGFRTYCDACAKNFVCRKRLRCKTCDEVVACCESCSEQKGTCHVEHVDDLVEEWFHAQPAWASLAETDDFEESVARALRLQQRARHARNDQDNDGHSQRKVFILSQINAAQHPGLLVAADKIVMFVADQHEFTRYAVQSKISADTFARDEYPEYSSVVQRIASILQRFQQIREKTTLIDSRQFFSLKGRIRWHPSTAEERVGIASDILSKPGAGAECMLSDPSRMKELVPLYSSNQALLRPTDSDGRISKFMDGQRSEVMRTARPLQKCDEHFNWVHLCLVSAPLVKSDTPDNQNLLADKAYGCLSASVSANNPLLEEGTFGSGNGRLYQYLNSLRPILAEFSQWWKIAVDIGGKLIQEKMAQSLEKIKCPGATQNLVGDLVRWLALECRDVNTLIGHLIDESEIPGDPHKLVYSRSIVSRDARWHIMDPTLLSAASEKVQAVDQRYSLLLEIRSILNVVIHFRATRDLCLHTYGPEILEVSRIFISSKHPEITLAGLDWSTWFFSSKFQGFLKEDAKKHLGTALPTAVTNGHFHLYPAGRMLLSGTACTEIMDALEEIQARESQLRFDFGLVRCAANPYLARSFTTQDVAAIMTQTKEYMLFLENADNNKPKSILRLCCGLLHVLSHLIRLGNNDCVRVIVGSCVNEMRERQDEGQNHLDFLSLLGRLVDFVVGCRYHKSLWPILTGLHAEIIGRLPLFFNDEFSDGGSLSDDSTDSDAAADIDTQVYPRLRTANDFNSRHLSEPLSEAQNDRVGDQADELSTDTDTVVRGQGALEPSIIRRYDALRLTSVINSTNKYSFNLFKLLESNIVDANTEHHNRLQLADMQRKLEKLETENEDLKQQLKESRAFDENQRQLAPVPVLLTETDFADLQKHESRVERATQTLSPDEAFAGVILFDGLTETEFLKLDADSVELSAERCRLFIEHLCLERTQHSQLRGALSGAIENLGPKLYEFPLHFMHELLQNVEDTQFVDDATLKVYLGSDVPKGADKYVLLSYNEAGFRPKDVRSVTSLTESTKTEGNSIGKKGIGFKSVFMISDKPHIISTRGNFQFYFDNSRSNGKERSVAGKIVSLPVADGFAMITPIPFPIPSDEYLQEHALPLTGSKIRSDRANNTQLYLPLNSAMSQRENFFSELDSAFDQGHLLLNMQQLQHISVYDGGVNSADHHSFRRRQSGEKKVFEHENGNITFKTMIIEREESTRDDNVSLSKKFDVFERKVEVLANDDGPNVWRESLLRLAFPVRDNAAPVTSGKRDHAFRDLGLSSSGMMIDVDIDETFPLYAYLPVCNLGFRFVCHADFDLVSSRAAVKDTIYNTNLRDHLAVLFSDICLSVLMGEHVREQLSVFFPYPSAAMSPWWLRFGSKIEDRLRGNNEALLKALGANQDVMTCFPPAIDTELRKLWQQGLYSVDWLSSNKIQVWNDRDLRMRQLFEALGVVSLSVQLLARAGALLPEHMTQADYDSVCCAITQEFAMITDPPLRDHFLSEIGRQPLFFRLGASASEGRVALSRDGNWSCKFVTRRQNEWRVPETVIVVPETQAEITCLESLGVELLCMTSIAERIAAIHLQAHVTGDHTCLGGPEDVWSDVIFCIKHRREFPSHLSEFGSWLHVPVRLGNAGDLSFVLISNSYLTTVLGCEVRSADLSAGAAATLALIQFQGCARSSEHLSGHPRGSVAQIECALIEWGCKFADYVECSSESCDIFSLDFSETDSISIVEVTSQWLKKQLLTQEAIGQMFSVQPAGSEIRQSLRDVFSEALFANQGLPIVAVPAPALLGARALGVHTSNDPETFLSALRTMCRTGVTDASAYFNVLRCLRSGKLLASRVASYFDDDPLVYLPDSQVFAKLDEILVLEQNSDLVELSDALAVIEDATKLYVISDRQNSAYSGVTSAFIALGANTDVTLKGCVTAIHHLKERSDRYMNEATFSSALAVYAVIERLLWDQFWQNCGIFGASDATSARQVSQSEHVLCDSRWREQLITRVRPDGQEFDISKQQAWDMVQDLLLPFMAADEYRMATFHDNGGLKVACISELFSLDLQREFPGWSFVDPRIVWRFPLLLAVRGIKFVENHAVARFFHAPGNRELLASEPARKIRAQAPEGFQPPSAIWVPVVYVAVGFIVDSSLRTVRTRTSSPASPVGRNRELFFEEDPSKLYTEKELDEEYKTIKLGVFDDLPYMISTFPQNVPLPPKESSDYYDRTLQYCDHIFVALAKNATEADSKTLWCEVLERYRSVRWPQFATGRAPGGSAEEVTACPPKFVSAVDWIARGIEESRALSHEVLKGRGGRGGVVLMQVASQPTTYVNMDLLLTPKPQSLERTTELTRQLELLANGTSMEVAPAIVNPSDYTKDAIDVAIAHRRASITLSPVPDPVARPPIAPIPHPMPRPPIRRPLVVCDDKTPFRDHRVMECLEGDLSFNADDLYWGRKAAELAKLHRGRRDPPPAHFLEQIGIAGEHFVYRLFEQRYDTFDPFTDWVSELKLHVLSRSGAHIIDNAAGYDFRIRDTQNLFVPKGWYPAARSEPPLCYVEVKAFGGAFDGEWYWSQNEIQARERFSFNSDTAYVLMFIENVSTLDSDGNDPTQKVRWRSLVWYRTSDPRAGRTTVLIENTPLQFRGSLMHSSQQITTAAQAASAVSTAVEETVDGHARRREQWAPATASRRTPTLTGADFDAMLLPRAFQGFVVGIPEDICESEVIRMLQEAGLDVVGIVRLRLNRSSGFLRFRNRETLIDALVQKDVRTQFGTVRINPNKNEMRHDGDRSARRYQQ